MKSILWTLGAYAIYSAGKAHDDFWASLGLIIAGVFIHSIYEYWRYGK